MSFGMYAASVPVFVKHLKSFSRTLDKGAAFAEARKIDPAVLLETRLYPDMFPLVRQVQEVTKHVRWACALLCGQDRPDVPLPETTFPELKKRIEDTIAFAENIRPDQIDGSETRAIVLKRPTGNFEYTGEGYLLGVAIPNFFFHITTAYGILRNVGVEIGKRDFMAQ